MTNGLLGVHYEEYKIDNMKVRAAVNFVDSKLYIHTPYGTIKCELSEYDNFEGDMQTFAKKKIKERW